MPGWESIVVGMVVVVALAWAARGVMRAVKQKRVCSDCASSGGCPLAQGLTDQAPNSTCQVDLVDLHPPKNN